jgi:hypothetical protein
LKYATWIIKMPNEKSNNSVTEQGSSNEASPGSTRSSSPTPGLSERTSPTQSPMSSAPTPPSPPKSPPLLSSFPGLEEKIQNSRMLESELVLGSQADENKVAERRNFAASLEKAFANRSQHPNKQLSLSLAPSHGDAIKAEQAAKGSRGR